MISVETFFGGAAYRAFTGDLILHCRSPRFLRVSGSSSPRIGFPMTGVRRGHCFVITNVGGTTITTSLLISLTSGQTAWYYFTGTEWLTYSYAGPMVGTLPQFSSLVVGGQPSPTATNELEYVTDTWVSRAVSPVSRDFAVGFLIGDRQYLTGDFPEDAADGPITHEFSLASNSWRTMMSCPFNPVRSTAGSTQSAGFAMSGDSRFNVAKFTRFAWTAQRTTPLARPRSSAGRFANLIYWMPGEPVPTTGLEYHPVVDAYVSIPAMGSTARYNASCLSVNSRILVCGGKVSPSTAYDLVDEYSPSSRTWLSKAVMSIGARHAGAALSNYHRGFYSGGADGSDTAQSAVGRLIGNSWVTVTSGPTVWGVANAGVSR